MKICLAGLAPHMQNIGDLALKSTAVLESFLDFRNEEEGLCKARFFMLDSGAFSFISGKQKIPDMDAYIGRFREDPDLRAELMTMVGGERA